MSGGPPEEPPRTSEPAPQSSRNSQGGEIPPAIADPLIGLVVIDRYRILEVIGRGGMGTVYKVEHTRLGKLLAMKLLTGELARNPEVVRRFKQEALTVSKLSSSNTVQVFDFGVAESGLTYLVMELVAGEDLGRVLRSQGPISFDRLSKIVVQVCKSLSEAHQKGIVHRDIKPENIMLIRGREEGEVAKVLDFGLAKLREGTELNELTSSGAIVGTPYYMAPEQIRGETVDERADIYALGVVMYRALSGAYPFSGATPMAVFTKHLSQKPEPPSARAKDLGIPAAADRIILRALQKNPADRFRTVLELQQALIEEGQALGSSSIQTLLDSTTTRAIADPKPGEVSASRIDHSLIATRNELLAFERKLRRKRYGLWLALIMLITLPATIAVVRIKKLRSDPAAGFTGEEHEPNSTAADANFIPYGRSIAGFIGKRIDATKSDRDFYVADIGAGPNPPEALIQLRTSALPNFALCTLVYRQGLTAAIGQYCVGRMNRDLVIPALRLEPGRYLFAVLQDMDPYGQPEHKFVHENISDAYTLSIEPAELDKTREIEPNDQIPQANLLMPGSSIAASLGWTRDEDVLCIPAETEGVVRWVVSDVIRDAGTVLEATPMFNASEAPSVRVHARGGFSPSDTDQKSPWTYKMAMPGKRCMRFRLVPDPLAGDKAPPVPTGASEAYVVHAEIETEAAAP